MGDILDKLADLPKNGIEIVEPEAVDRLEAVAAMLNEIERAGGAVGALEAELNFGQGRAGAGEKELRLEKELDILEKQKDVLEKQKDVDLQRHEEAKKQEEDEISGMENGARPTPSATKSGYSFARKVLI